MNYVDYLLRKLQEGDKAFFAWFTSYQIDAFSGWLPAGQTEHGFPPPDRPADAFWYFPSEEEERLLQAPVSPEQYELWQEQALGEVLVIRQCADIVMAINHFAWFRIPLPAIAQYMQAQGDILAKKNGGHADARGGHLSPPGLWLSLSRRQDLLIGRCAGGVAWQRQPGSAWKSAPVY